jgi:hypothetical protein
MADSSPAESTADLLDRIRRLEAALAERPAAVVPAADEQQLADRVLAVLAARRQANGAPDGLLATRPLLPIDLDAPPGMAGPPPGEQGFRSWLLVGVLGEFRMMLRMYLDPRYRLSRVAQFGVPLVLGLFFVNYVLFNYSCFPAIPIVSQVGERLAGIVLAVMLYKVMLREVGRYRQVLDYLARYGYH